MDQTRRTLAAAKRYQGPPSVLFGKVPMMAFFGRSLWNKILDIPI
jgi:hypothetical protein